MKISIIIPVYNGAQFIEKRFKEIESYHNPEAEFIFVNDGSTDDSLRLLWKYRDKTSQDIVILSMLENQGCLKAIRLGLDIASHDSVLTIDIDDPFSFSYLEGLAFDLEAQPPHTMITIPKQLFVNGKPNGQVWRIPQYDKPEQYIVSLFINHSGLIALNNTIHDRKMMIKACDEAIKLLEVIGVERMDYGEDTLRASIMIHQGLVSKILPSRTYSVPYTFDNSESQSKDNDKKMRDKPVMVAYAYYCVYSEIDEEMRNRFADICRNKYGDRADWFAGEVERYVEKMRVYYKQLS